MRERKGQRNWSEVVAAFRKSGTTKKAFCERAGIALSSLSYHLKREVESVPAPARRFVELSAPRDSITGVELEILLPNGTALRLRG